MLYVLLALILIACLILWVVVLVQNPKGGGLSSQFGGGVSNIIGAKSSVDFMEKATWTMAIAVLSLVLLTNFVIPYKSVGVEKASELQDQANETVIPVDESAPSGGQQLLPPPEEDGGQQGE